MDIAREEANLLRILSEGGGSLVIDGDDLRAAWEHLVAVGFVTAATQGEDSVRYELTDAGRAFLET